MYDYDEMPDPPMPPDNSQVVPIKVEVVWNNVDVIRQVVRAIAKSIYDDIKPKVEKAILDGLDAQVNEIIGNVLDKEVQRTDQWGKPQGQSVSIRDLLMRDAEQWLNEKVDRYGRTGSTYGRDCARAQYLFNKLLTDGENRTPPLSKMVQAAIKDSIGDIETMVNEAVREQIKRKLK